jgi:hypothetical protein
MVNAKTPMTPMQQNAIARMMLMGNESMVPASVPVRIKLGTFSAALGDTLRVKILNVGMTTKLTYQVRAQIDITALATPSATSGVYGLTPQVRFVDYNQIERVACDAYSLSIINGFRKRRISETFVSPAGFAVGAAEVADINNQPTAIANNQLLNYFVDVPLAVDPENGDFRGMSFSQTVVGEQFLNIKIADALVGTDPTLFAYTAGTMTLDSLVVDVWQEYLTQPQDPAAIPLMDVSTVYEIKGLFRSPSDIASGGQKIINYPNVRNILSSTHVLVDNNAPMGETQIASVDMFLNSANVLRQDSFASLRRRMRNTARGDAASGTIHQDHRSYPISTYLYGNVQIYFTFATITGGNTYALSAFESTYAAGSPLPGITTQG